MLPGIVTYLLRTAAIGALIGMAVAALLIVTDAAGMGTMIRDSQAPFAPVALLLLGFATLIGSLYTGTSIMMLPCDTHDRVWQSIRVEPKSKGD